MSAECTSPPAAAEGGLFAEQGLDIEFVGCARAPDYSLQGFAARPKAIAAGQADFALSSVAYCWPLRASWAGACRSALPRWLTSAIRSWGSFAETRIWRGRRTWPGPGRRAGACPGLPGSTRGRLTTWAWARPWWWTEGRTSTERSAPVDVTPAWMEMSLHHRQAGYPIRTIALDIGVYSTGLLAADRLSSELVSRMRDAFGAGHDLQLEQPELGIWAFRRRFPDVSVEHIQANWALFEPYAVDGVSPGSMDAERWEATIEHTAATHSLSPLSPERLYRPELLASTVQ